MLGPQPSHRDLLELCTWREYSSLNDIPAVRVQWALSAQPSLCVISLERLFRLVNPLNTTVATKRRCRSDVVPLLSIDGRVSQRHTSHKAVCCISEKVENKNDHTASEPPTSPPEQIFAHEKRQSRKREPSVGETKAERWMYLITKWIIKCPAAPLTRKASQADLLPLPLTTWAKHTKKQITARWEQCNLFEAAFNIFTLNIQSYTSFTIGCFVASFTFSSLAMPLHKNSNVASVLPLVLFHFTDRGFFSERLAVCEPCSRIMWEEKLSPTIGLHSDWSQANGSCAANLHSPPEFLHCCRRKKNVFCHLMKLLSGPLHKITVCCPMVGLEGIAFQRNLRDWCHRHGDARWLKERVHCGTQLMSHVLTTGRALVWPVWALRWWETHSPPEVEQIPETSKTNQGNRQVPPVRCTGRMLLWACLMGSLLLRKAFNTRTENHTHRTFRLPWIEMHSAGFGPTLCHNAESIHCAFVEHKKICHHFPDGQSSSRWMASGDRKQWRRIKCSNVTPVYFSLKCFCGSNNQLIRKTNSTNREHNVFCREGSRSTASSCRYHYSAGIHTRLSRWCEQPEPETEPLLEMTQFNFCFTRNAHSEVTVIAFGRLNSPSNPRLTLNFSFVIPWMYEKSIQIVFTTLSLKAQVWWSCPELYIQGEMMLGEMSGWQTSLKWVFINLVGLPSMLTFVFTMDLTKHRDLGVFVHSRLSGGCEKQRRCWLHCSNLSQRSRNRAQACGTLPKRCHDFFSEK